MGKYNKDKIKKQKETREIQGQSGMSTEQQPGLTSGRKSHWRPPEAGAGARPPGTGAGGVLHPVMCCNQSDFQLNFPVTFTSPADGMINGLRGITASPGDWNALLRFPKWASARSGERDNSGEGWSTAAPADMVPRALRCAHCDGGAREESARKNCSCR